MSAPRTDPPPSKRQRIQKVSSKKVLEIPGLPQSSLPQYPSQHFENNKEKPEREILTSNMKIDDLRNHLSRAIEDQTVTPALAKEGLARLAPLLETFKIKEDWKSYGVTIASKGEDVHPLTAVRVKTSETLRVNAQIPQALLSDAVIVTVLLGKGRAYSYPHAAYQNQVWGNVQSVVTSLGGPGIPCNNKPLHDLTNDADYVFLAAAIDMFYHKFPESRYAAVRVGSLIYRYKDCAAYTALLDTAVRWNTDPNGVVQWVFSSPAASEIEGMMGGDEELEDGYSYFPYASSMRLVRKSFYSSSTCPNFHNWCHTAGTLEGVMRSKNATWMERSAGQVNITAGWLAAYAHSATADVGVQFAPEGAVGDPEDDDEGPYDRRGRGGKKIPRSHDPLEWMDWWITIGKSASADMKAFASNSQKEIVNPRGGSVGEKIKRLLFI